MRGRFAGRITIQIALKGDDAAVVKRAAATLEHQLSIETIAQQAIVAVARDINRKGQFTAPLAVDMRRETPEERKERMIHGEGAR